MLNRGSGLRLLAYTSRYTGGDIVRDLDDIARASWRNNPARGITGALIYDAGRFVQVLEGPGAVIERIYATIMADARSVAVETLIDTTIDWRTMPEWTMWVGSVNEQAPSGGLETEALKTFRDAYSKAFKLDAMGFVLVLRAMMEGVELVRPVVSEGGPP
jgi:hypothetical protein